MRLLSILRLRLRSLFLRRRADAELDEELQYHFERQIELELTGGKSPDEARWAALRAIRNMQQRKEECREMRGSNTLENAAQDIRYSLRTLSKSPGFASLVVLLMALGIGANTAVFSVVNGVLLKPLAYRDADRIVTFASTWVAGSKAKLVSLPDFRDWHDQSTAFSAMACYRSSDEPATAGSSAEYVHAARISANFFETLGITPVIGRSFSSEEQQSQDADTALISYSYWQSHFGADNAVLGKSLRVGDQALTIVGVLQPRFHFPDNSDIWRPLDAVDRTLPRTSLAFHAIGRLKPGVKLPEAQAQLTSISARLSHDYPDSNKGRSVTVAEMRDDMVSDVRVTLYLLLGAVGLVLLIACANVATLLLTKATARTREIAIRAALGGARARIIRQLLTESLLIALLAGGAGLALVSLGSKALIALAPADIPRLTEIGIDGRVLAFTFAASVACSLLFGLAPAFYSVRIDLNDALKQGGARNVAAGRSSHTRAALVVAEIALSIMLLAGAGLLIRSFVALSNVTLGFAPRQVLLMKTSLPVSGPQGDQHAQTFFRQLQAEIASLPGVSAAGATMGPPGDVESAGGFFVDHLPAHPESNSVDSVFSVVMPGTLRALGIPLKHGRDIEPRDEAHAPFVALINEKLARRAFPGQDPIGRVIFAGFDAMDKPMKIVGVVGDVRQWGPAREPDAEIYMPYAQHTSGAGSSLYVVVRTTASPAAITNELRRIVQQLSPDAPVRFSSLSESLYQETAAPRFRTLLLGIFAALALSLAVGGIYGVTAYVVTQRSNEIGLRMAMGATPGHVLQLILKRSMILALAGMIAGFAGSLAATRWIGSVLFEVKANDPATYAGVAALLAAVILAASYLPARRAAKLDPLIALRQE